MNYGELRGIKENYGELRRITGNYGELRGTMGITGNYGEWPGIIHELVAYLWIRPSIFFDGRFAHNSAYFSRARAFFAGLFSLTWQVWPTANEKFVHKWRKKYNIYLFNYIYICVCKGFPCIFLNFMDLNSRNSFEFCAILVKSLEVCAIRGSNSWTCEEVYGILGNLWNSGILWNCIEYNYGNLIQFKKNRRW